MKKIDGHPISFEQERIWLLSQIHGHSPALQEGGGAWIDGDLDVARLHAALQEVASRHEILRTVFVERDGMPAQIVRPHLQVDFAPILLDTASDEAALQAARVAAASPFTPSAAPPWRTRLVHVHPRRHLLALSLHSLVADATSVGLLLADILSSYRGDAGPAPALHYVEYAHAQASEVATGTAEGLAFFREQLTGAAPVLEVWGDVAIKPDPSLESAATECTLRGGFAAAASHSGEAAPMEHEASLLASLATVLHRSSGQREVVFALRTSGRDRPRWAHLMGPVGNLVPVRVSFDDDPTWRVLVARVATSIEEARARQVVPFQQIVEALAPPRIPGRTPLAQVLFEHRIPYPALHGGLDLALNAVDLRPSWSPFDLSASFSEQDGTLRLEHRTALFSTTAARRLLRSWEALVRTGRQSPAARVSSLPVLTAGERAVMVSGWNDTAADFARNAGVHHLFERHVELTPGAEAVVLEDQSLTFLELDRRANQLAHRLRELGVGPETLVACCMERSLEAVVAFLGILKAGGAYLPLDPAYPAERLAFILEDSAAPVVLTLGHLEARLPPRRGVTLRLDLEWADIARRSPSRPQVATSPLNAAYSIYTSGSTGRPKGVVVDHRNGAQLVEAQRRAFGVGPGDRVLQLVSLGFDVSVGDFILALCAGATLCLIPPAASLPGPALAARLRRHRVTFATFVPSVLNQQPLEALPDLATVVVIGEACPAALVERWAPGRRFVNAYGPTECTVYATTADCAPGTGAPPIGRPMANTRTYVLDGHGHPAQVGVAGELYLGGTGVTRGYLGRPALTAERFVPDPFAEAPGARMYRTGDRTRWREDGALEFLGRLDHQLKIRGVRVELGEVEAHLCEHATVHEAVVIARDFGPGDVRLVAYVVAPPQPPAVAQGVACTSTSRPAVEAPSAQTLRTFLRERLPDAMIPSAFVVLDVLPLTPSGKVDRRALPSPQGTREEHLGAFVDARNPQEAHLVALWRELLHTARIGIHDDFFALGGHSLQAVQMLARIRRDHHVDLTFSDLFASPTVAALAALLCARRPSVAQALIPIPSLPRGGLLPLSFAQERLWFLHKLAPESTAYTCATLFRLEGPLDTDALRKSLDDLAQRHEILRTTFIETDGAPAQRVHEEMTCHFTAQDLSALAVPERDAEMHRHLDAEMARPFDLEGGPLFRAALLRAGAGEHVLLLGFHHIVTDGWSMGIVLRELAASYKARRDGLPTPLCPLAVQYADYAAWQRRTLDDAALDEHLAYWRATLAGAPPLLELPADRPRLAALSFRGATASFRLEASTAHALRELARARSLTPTMALLAVYAALVHRYTHRDDLVIGIPVAGRERVELEATLGFFVNTVPVRLDLSGDPTFEELLHRVGKASVEAYEHATVPFERLVQELRIARNPSYNPLVQIAFAPQPPGERHLALDGVTVHPIAAKARSTIFDLSLFCWEESDGSVQGAIEHSTDLYDRWRIDGMIRHFLALAEEATLAPHAPLSTLPMLSAEERLRIVDVLGRGPSRPLPLSHCLHTLFEDQVDRDPDAPAVVAEGRAFTYREIDEAANRLARRLREAGAGPGTLVASCLARSSDVVVAFFGILKAGAAYLPLDPAHPADRLAFLLEDSGAPVLLSHAATAGRLAGHCAVTLQMPAVDAGREPSGAPRLCSQVRPADPAYVIYTSGSTGRPKGVVVEHRNAVHLVEAGRDPLALAPGSRVLQTAALGFDASIWELLMTLCAGATLYIEPLHALLPGADLSRSLRRHRITAVFLPPSVLAQQPVEAFPDLETLIVGGEACPAELVDRWAQGRRLLNAYGPTECAVASTMTACSPGQGAPPIGRPLANVRVLPLGPRGELVPVGVPGELHLGGSGVARGYLRRPELTQERFLPDPFDDTPGARLYRTGDWARFLPDGQLEFLGRIDDQVKVRGVRIELQEIEKVILEHPAVQEATVLLREDTPGERRLVAYIAPRPGCPGIAVEKGAIEAEQVSDWRDLYDDTYGRAPAPEGDVTFNISGWTSSYTSAPIPAEDMRTWRDGAVARILALRPQRVWEIGCGTGLLLYQLAPRCAAYLGTDFSEAAISLLRSGTAARGYDHVRLEQREANSFHPTDEGRFDVVVLNSIVQYFPDARYLRAVVEGAARAVRPGGVIFIGDVRSLPLLPAFHASVELHRAPARLPTEVLRERVRRAIATESELVLDPGLFHRFAREIPGLGGAEVWVKRGPGDDEMTRHRYDVLLHVGSPPPSVVVDGLRRFDDASGSLASIERWLTADQPRALEIHGVPNARVLRDARCHERLATLSCTAEALGARAAEDAVGAIVPENLWLLGERLGYEVRVAPGHEDPYTVDVLFERTALGRPRTWWSRAGRTGCPERASHASHAGADGLPAAALANDPVSGKRAQRLLPTVRAALQHRLPDYMVPSAFVALDQLPLTPNGKIDRRALPPPDRKKSELSRDFTGPRTPLEEALCAIWCEALEIEQVGIDDPFFEIGGHSLLLARVRATITARLGHDLPMVELFQRPTIRSLAAHLDASTREATSPQEASSTHAETASTPSDRPALLPTSPSSDAPPRNAYLPATSPRDATSPNAVAIIGMTGRFPGARDVDELWRNLCAGVDSITFSTAEQLDAAGVDVALQRNPRFVPAVGQIDDALGFDAGFFGYSPLEAKLMDPQHRTFLECAWEALESAGYGPRAVAGVGTREAHPGARVGVFGGCDAPRYWMERIGAQYTPLSVEEYQVMVGNVADTLTTRAAYKLDLRGPALTVMTACSTSLVAVHLACQSLRAGECTVALAGASVILPPDRLGHIAEEGAITSLDGHCRPFDAEAQGIVGASGVALVVLKRLDDALRDGDTIHAVIRGSAIGNDGGSKVGFMAPGLEGQAEVITRAQEAADIDPDSIGLVEAHGTATALGDPIEVAALTRAFRRATDRRGYCALGSLKGNIGHTGATSGVAGLIKAALALKHGVIPPTLHFRRPNPGLDLDASPFFVNTTPLPWPRSGTARRAGVSAFGVGGTNAHVILEEAPEIAASAPCGHPQLLLLSARTDAALETATDRLAARFTAEPELNTADAAFTLQLGRAEFPRRRAILGGDATSTTNRLRTRDAAWVCTDAVTSTRPKVVFMFPGGGSQDRAMGRALYEAEPVYRDALDHVASLFRDALEVDIRPLLFADDAGRPEADARLRTPSLNLAAIFATEHALAELLCAWGITPAAVTGHSLGEYAAARLAGVLSLEDAVALVALRARLYEELPSDTATLIVPLSEANLRRHLRDGLSLAAVNAPDVCVVSGKLGPLAALEDEIRRDGLEPRRLPLAAAAHSSLIAPLAHRLGERAARMDRHPPRIPVVSNVTGGWLDAREACDPHYWTRHLAGTVRFSDGLTTLFKDPSHVLVEVGPGRTLSTLARRHPDGAQRAAYSTMAGAGSSRSDLEAVLFTVGQLWCAGAAVDFGALWRGQQRRRIPLPTYPFERTPHLFRSAAAPAPPTPSVHLTLPTMVPSAGSLPPGSFPPGSFPPGSLPPGSFPPPTLPPNASGRSSNVYMTMQNDVVQTIAAIWREALGVDQTRPDDNFFDLGGDSLIAVKVLARVMEQLGVQLPVHALVETPTFSALTSRIRSDLPVSREVDGPPSAPPSVPPPPSRRTRLIVRLSDGSGGVDRSLRRDSSPPSQRGAGRALFLIQPIGGTVFSYVPLARALGVGIPVYGIRASGMEPGEPVLDDVGEMALRYLQELRTIQPSGPYTLGGHSAGGVIAHEMARQLVAAGERIALLALLDTPSPLGIRRARIEGAEDLLRHAESFRDHAQRAYQGFTTALREETALGAVMVATWRAISTYEPTPLDVETVYLRAREARDPLDPCPEQDWGQLAPGAFSLHRVPGNHFSMMDTPHVSEVARRLDQHLALLDGPMATRRSPGAAEPLASADALRWVS
ncbi:hybrid non-ribosomal peptide synthetase/type I polyketide synthase [Chondromyces apiculatus]|uniref:Long-chain-fatty-acid--CoA ligase n=1 Tax=Chondromyces apiculatus DSM 436 TaxID=1192034 RepID=A0A017T1P3_9BACT|nr:hybrid non-ribosomal peptide synthetase/type I polyketide synthase [Chondromyces apiculatus]EYF02912.1 Long-chain-fatty-acid--CoA ligase [Chondromyces apiculatus DSM 436]